MNKKSKFITFLLSFVFPGLGHLYVGYGTRGFVFFGLILGVIFGCQVMGILTLRTDFFNMLRSFGLPVIWFISLVDAISLADVPDREGVQGEEEGNVRGAHTPAVGVNRTLIAAALSLIPGAGHMYLGYLKYGAELMGAFFMAIFLMGWLNMPFFLFLLPVIWFYSLFDAIHRAEGNIPPENLEGSPLSWINRNPRLAGLGLVLLGCIAVLDRLIFPNIDWQTRNYLQTGMVSFILIVTGAKLIKEGISKAGKSEEKGGDSDQCANGK
ncbi:MAG: hypothetical protein L5655_09205 [Thermosediminibacteraceae bacterium]|nr:hypothetical protein [Thermosediminibacteraceae bacterium]